VNYPEAQKWWICGQNGYNELFNQSKLKIFPKISHEVLLKIQLGGLKSEFLAPDFQSMIQESMV